MVLVNGAQLGRSRGLAGGRLEVGGRAQQLLPQGKHAARFGQGVGPLQGQAGVLLAELLPLELLQGEGQLFVQLQGDGFGLGLGLAQHGMAAELQLHLLPFVAVHPDEQFRVAGVGDAVGDAVGPVLGEALLLGVGLEAGARQDQLHLQARVRGAHVVVPDGGHRLVHAPVPLHHGRLHVAQVTHLVAGVLLADLQVLPPAEEALFGHGVEVGEQSSKGKEKVAGFIQ